MLLHGVTVVAARRAAERNRAVVVRVVPGPTIWRLLLDELVDGLVAPWKWLVRLTRVVR